MTNELIERAFLLALSDTVTDGARKTMRTLRHILTSAAAVASSAWLRRPHEKSDRGLRGQLHEEQAAHRFLESSVSKPTNHLDSHYREGSWDVSRFCISTAECLPNVA
jgi:hypothetical protein